MLHQRKHQPTPSTSTTPRAAGPIRVNRVLPSTPKPPTHPTTTPHTKPPLITLDLLLYVLSETLFHPFLSALLPLCLRSLAYPYDSPAFILTTLFAAANSLYQIFAWINRRVAFGVPREMQWEKEVVVITGGKRGLGGVLAEVLGLRGVSVAVLDLDVTGEEEGEGGGQGRKGDGVRYWRCDVGNLEEVERVWEKVVKDLGAPTILINNAGISRPSTVLEQTPQDVSRIFATNTLSHFYLTQLFLRSLAAKSPKRIRTGGHIVTITSVLAYLGAANLSAYTASKAALTAYHASLSAELAQSFPNVRAILVAPGQLDTDLFQQVKVRGWVQQFTGPVVGAQELALKIVALLDQGMAGEVRTPVYAALIPWLGVLPDAVRIALRRWSGVDEVVAVGLIGSKEREGLKTNVEAETEVAESDESSSDSPDESSNEDDQDG